MKQIAATIILSLCCYTNSHAVTECLNLTSPGNTYPCSEGCGGCGNCTWYAAYKRPDLNFLKIVGQSRDAGNWAWYAQHYGFQLGAEPVENSIANFSSPGHVAYVESVDNDGSFQVTEQDCTCSFNNQGQSFETATYKPSEGNKYKRGAGTTEYELSGFIYPTRIILYQYQQIDGALILIRTDGRIAQNCNEVDRVSMFSIDTLKRIKQKRDFIRFDGTYSGKYAIKLCEQATRHFGFYDINFAKFLQGEIVSNEGLGGGTSTQPTDPPASGKLPDFITDKVILANESGSKEKYTWKINETAYVHSWTDNIGTADWEGKAKKIKVSFYLSKGTKEDPHSEWVRVGREEIKKEHLDVKDKPKREKIAFNIPQWAAAGYIFPGRTYNFVVCADRPKDQDNGDGDVKEKHKSNNCSTEAVFYVDSNEPPAEADLTANSLQFNSGSTTLTGGSLYGLTVNVRNAGNGSADSGFQIKYEIKGPSTNDQWQAVGEKGFAAVPFAAGADQQISTNDSFAAAPTVEGDYLLRACADSKQAVAESNEDNNCSEELAVYVSPASEFLAKPVYRFWSSEQSSHFYTISEAEKDRVIAIYTPYQWQYERVEGCALPSQEDDSLPVYRFYSSPLTLHRFTISEEEKDSLMAMPETFKYEGIAWYAYTYQKEGTVPVYRFYSETYKSYFYTVSEAERDLVLEKYPDEIWRYDGIAWYIFECP